MTKKFAVCLCEAYTELKDVAPRISSIVTGSEDHQILKDGSIELGQGAYFRLFTQDSHFWLEYEYGDSNHAFLYSLKSCIRYLLGVDVLNS